MTAKQVKEDLQNIRYYYMHKASFDQAENTGFKSKVVQKAEQYGRLVSGAPPRLYIVYNLLYVEGKTQYAAAIEQNVTDGYIRNLAVKLQQYLLNEINRKEEKVNEDREDA